MSKEHDGKGHERGPRHERISKSDMQDKRTPDLRDTTGKDGEHNHGRETSAAHFGQTVIEDYGLDRSTMAGNAADERGDKIDGSFDDLSHSIEGVRATQGPDKLGRKDTTS